MTHCHMITVGLVLVFAGLLSDSLPYDHCGIGACVCRDCHMITVGLVLVFAGLLLWLPCRGLGQATRG